MRTDHALNQQDNDQRGHDGTPFVFCEGANQTNAHHRQTTDQKTGKGTVQRMKNATKAAFVQCPQCRQSLNGQGPGRRRKA